MNTITNLLRIKFSSLSFDEKLQIKELGRSTPCLNLEQVVTSKNRTYKLIYNTSNYEKYKWISGCDQRQSLHCFPCLLFGGEDIWTKKGFKDLNHLAYKAKRHENSQVHMQNAVSLSLLGIVNIENKLESQYRNKIKKHNENVKDNRYILNIIINCIKFCGSFELALRGHNENESSTNPGVFRGLINFTAELDNSLRAHLEKASVFKRTSNKIQNELLQIMLEICQEEIVREITEADFISVIADETSDVSNIYQMVVVFRYIVKGKPTERFWNFISPEKHDSKTLTDCLLKEIEKLGINKEKLIAQTYDGANVMRGSSSGVQALVKEIYPKAEYIHCHAHQLNLVMQNATSCNRNVRHFFGNLQAICVFFSTSPKRTKILDDIVNQRLPRATLTRWNYHSKSVNVVYTHKEEIKECFQFILNDENFQDTNTTTFAYAYIKMFDDSKFIFWLNFFNRIMTHVDILYGQLQNRRTEPSTIKTHIETFEKQILNIRENFNFQESADNVSKRTESGMSDLSREGKEVCDNIICQIKERFKFTGHLIAATLFQHKKFVDYDTKFPDTYLKETCISYPFLSIKKLQTELNVLYNTKNFQEMSGRALAFLDFITENNLEDTFSECAKILKVLITIPMTTSEAERCFSTLKRIKTFLRNTMDQERLSALAMLSIEKDFITKIADFNNKVIEKFALAKERRMDFLLK